MRSTTTYQAGAGGISSAMIVSRGVLLILACLLAVIFSPSLAYAEGPNAILKPSNYNTNLVARADDTANQVVGLPFTMNWNGTNYTQIYINMNGNCTFGSGYTGYNPSTALSSLGQNIMAPFWADVDTRNTSMGQVTYSNINSGSIPQVGGRNAFFVNWIDVGRYNYTSSGNTETNSFQLVIVDRSDTGAGNFDFIFNYDKATWDIATASSTAKARVGWGRSGGTGFELDGSGAASGSTSTLLDSSASATSLVQNTVNASGQLGRYVFQVRNGGVPNIPPTLSVVNRVLEGNASNSYVGYAGVGDATATDPDGTIVSLTHSRPTVLPLGTTSVKWTATDSNGESVTATQSIVVTDTTPPGIPTLTSSTHTIGVWSTVSTVTINSSATTDTCSGVAGASYVWSLNSTTTPDTIFDPSTTTTTTVTTTPTIENQAFATATWPADWVRVLMADAGDPDTYLRSQNTQAVSGYAAELWTNSNNTRRTMGFYKDFDLSTLSSATLSFYESNTGLDSGSDYAMVHYSTDGGSSWILLLDSTGSVGWNVRSYALPTGGTVRVRFSGSVNRTNEYCDWDDISITGTKTVTTVSNTVSSTTALADGIWYFNIRTRDVAGNWSATTSLGTIRVDRNAPVTTSNAPSTWQNANVSVTLTATDAGQVTSTIYKLNAGAVTTYASPVLMSTEGTSTLLFRSTDAAGNVEATKTATIRIDKTAPTVPTTITASALSTTSAHVTWAASTDAFSGVARYDVYRDSVLVGTSTTTTFTQTGLTSGQTYLYSVRAVDTAGNTSAQTTQVSVLIPASQLWMSVSENSVLMNAITPGAVSTVTSATTVSVGGVGATAYDLSCTAPDFLNTNTLSSTPSFPIGAMSFVTHGRVEVATRVFATAPVLVDSTVGSAGVWRYDYRLDFAVLVPISNEPGTYTTTVTYTFVPK